MSDPITTATAEVDAALGRLDDVLLKLTDGDLHRAHRGGGWTVAHVISHMNVSTLLWLGGLTRLRNDPDLRFFFREEVGHDALGYPPPTLDLARGQVAATRRTLATCVPTVDPDVLSRSVEIPDLGVLTIAEWTPLILGHLTGHVEQTFEIMRDREFAPAGV